MSKAIAYILNPEKTDEKLLVSSYGCASETAAREFEWTRKIAEQKGMNPVRIIARHVIQSFEIGEVTPELAHEIGKQFADEILGGKYEYVLTTHIDKDHVHNHLIFNAVDFMDYHAYKSYKRIYYDMREVSDRLCKENGLSVIPPSQNKGMGYKEYTEAKRGTSWKQKLKQTIDRLVITAKDYDDFLRLMQEAGYEIKTGKYISFRAEGQERFTRSKTIGENYIEERIKERIAGRTPRRNRRQTVPKGISLIGDIQERIRLCLLYTSFLALGFYMTSRVFVDSNGIMLTIGTFQVSGLLLGNGNSCPADFFDQLRRRFLNPNRCSLHYHTSNGSTYSLNGRSTM